MKSVVLSLRRKVDERSEASRRVAISISRFLVMVAGCVSQKIERDAKFRVSTKFLTAN
jgi:hypothetical protein